MANRIEHLGIAVADVPAAVQIFTDLLGHPPYKTEAVPSEGVDTVFFQVGESKVELLAATAHDSPIAKFLDNRGPGIHHVAFAVDNLEAELARLQGLGYRLIHTEPKDGADNQRIAFLHPRGTNGVLVELCQSKAEA